MHDVMGGMSAGLSAISQPTPTAFSRQSATLVIDMSTLMEVHLMDDDQLVPPPPPPEEPIKRQTGARRIAVMGLLAAGLLAGTGAGSFVIAHAATSSSPSSGTSLTASTTTPAPTATPKAKTPSTVTCPHMGGSTSTSG
jgi:hypothetical protein